MDFNAELSRTDRTFLRLTRPCDFLLGFGDLFEELEMHFHQPLHFFMVVLCELGQQPLALRPATVFHQRRND